MAIARLFDVTGRRAVVTGGLIVRCSRAGACLTGAVIPVDGDSSTR